MRTLLLTVVVAGIVAWTGFPVRRDGSVGFGILPTVTLAASMRSASAVPLPAPAERWRESASLTLLAAGLFAAAFGVNRAAHGRAGLRPPVVDRPSAPPGWSAMPAKRLERSGERGAA